MKDRAFAKTGSFLRESALPGVHYVLLALLSLAMLWAFILWFIIFDRQRSEADIMTTNQLLTRALEEHIERTLLGNDDFLLALKEEYARHGSESVAIQTLFSRASSDSVRYQASMFDADGQLIASVLRGVPQNVFDSIPFQYHLQNDDGGLLIGPPKPSKVNGQLSLALTRRLNHADNSFGGIAVILLDADYFTQFYDKLGLVPGQWVRIVGRDGVVRAERMDECTAQAFNCDVFQHLNSNATGSFISSGTHHNGKKAYISYRALAHYPLVVQVGFNLDAALEDTLSRRTFIVQIGATSSLFIGLFVCALVRRSKRQQQAETLIRQSEAQYKLLAENTCDVVSRHSFDVHILYASPSIEQLLGYRPEEIIGQSSWLFIHPEDAARVEEEIIFLRQGAQVVRYEMRMLRKDGTPVWVDTISRLIPALVPGEPPEFLCITRDMTAWRDIMKEVAAMERMAALGTMSASIAHEINQPLQTVKVAADAFLYWHQRGRQVTADKFAGYMETIAKQTERITAIITRLREYASVESPANNERIDLNFCIEDALAMMSHQLDQHHVNIVRDFGAMMPDVKADAMKVEGVIINIVLNALHALETVDCEHKTIWVKTAVKGNHAVIEIGNNGPLIPGTVLPRIFQPFFTTKERTEGLGLGLHIARAAILTMNGNIQAENKEPGVVFTITLPLAEAA